MENFKSNIEAKQGIEKNLPVVPFSSVVSFSSVVVNNSGPNGS